ncbi:single-stranded-DNA-specific exonuclease RecJ [Limibacter armeniacum]|uniref:single-stranded-DNA-specific exonuclease RecJ n=1 Tax=Limibacter armeniacum TaxID=466084 RepID=UPI002FE63918
MKHTVWKIKEQATPEQVGVLCNAINVSAPMASLLFQRGVTDYDSAKKFFRGGLSLLHDPAQMADMSKAVNRLSEALENEEQILFYGDYDVDGTTSVAMFLSFFKDVYPYVDYYIPDKYREGYGISDRGLAYAEEIGATLIITLDCGIQEVEQVQKAKESGIEVIICDHHQPDDVLPSAVAILNPKREDCPYPYKGLSGCGVGFKLLQAFCQEHDVPEDDLWRLTDLLAVSIACDIVPITGENRVLAKEGLRRLESTENYGLQALMKRIKGDEPVTISKLVFGMGPRLNAAGRVAHANLSVKLLTSNSHTEAENFLKDIETKNQQRKAYDQLATAQALQMIKENGWGNRFSTVLYHPDWHKGVVGIVASRCTEVYYRPTVVLTFSDGFVTGSARSVGDFDLYGALHECREYFISFGGHKAAAGIKLLPDDVDSFRVKFEEVVKNKLNGEEFVEELPIDVCLNLDQVTANFYTLIQQMRPFGPENRQPLFMSERLNVSGNVRVLKDKHLKFTVRQEGRLHRYEAIGFGMATDYLSLLESGESFDICYHIQANEYRNNRFLQLVIKDIRIHGKA